MRACTSLFRRFTDTNVPETDSVKIWHTRHKISNGIRTFLLCISPESALPVICMSSSVYSSVSPGHLATVVATTATTVSSPWDYTEMLRFQESTWDLGDLPNNFLHSYLDESNCCRSTFFYGCCSLASLLTSFSLYPITWHHIWLTCSSLRC